MTIDAMNLLVSSSTSIPYRAGDTAADPMSTIMDANRSASLVSPEGLNCFPSAIVNCMMGCVLVGDTLILCQDSMNVNIGGITASFSLNRFDGPYDDCNMSTPHHAGR